ncbi:(2Fe-2S)-binding protein [Lysinibacillus sp. BW-2-10]|uniref:(2Fe-2S)-binding protein n=1 Tax=Lysinibacillus sp. BW-2-10 TaxID=2590030 RepID=UPI00117E185D|nr:(2Fe-2S)-binding protein [Lysinibacillus sp. BW-2-10]TSI07681.1 hypothetical protein FJQ64_08280 [Lysinibacillus sp. BW-2-10]
MLNTFTPKEMAMLQDNYRFTTKVNISNLPAQVSHLLNEDQLYLYLSSVKEQTKAANLSVAASLFVKRYSFAVLIALYSMSVLSKRINFSINNVSIQTLKESDLLWLPSIHFRDITLYPALQEDRNNWRNDIVNNIFANHIDILFNQLNTISKLPKRTMWENLYTYIVWMYKNLLQDRNHLDNHYLIKEDFNMITYGSEGYLFGTYEQNPFLEFRDSQDCSDILEGNSQKRKTCCLSYLTKSKGDFCKNCPISVKKSKINKYPRLSSTTV